MRRVHSELFSIFEYRGMREFFLYIICNKRKMLELQKIRIWKKRLFLWWEQISMKN